MAVTTHELAERQRFNGKSGTREYYFSDTVEVTAATARTALLADAPASWAAGGSTLNLDPDGCEVYESGTTFFGVARYKSPEGATLPVNESAFSFSTQGQTIKRMHSLGTTAYGTDPPATGGLIGQRGGEVEGVDIVAPAFAYKITQRHPLASVTSTFIRTLIDSTGTVNSGTLNVTTDDGISFSLAAGENLYLGATGGVIDDEVELVHDFVTSPNATGISIGSITGIAKLGWQYLWVKWTDLSDQNELMNTPRAVYVETVYPTADHDDVLNP